MAIYSAVLNTCQQLAKKASLGMRSILSKNLIPPYSPTGIISKTDLSVEGDGQIVTMETHFPDYAYWVEYGRGPGKQPPVNNLIDWCRQHPDRQHPERPAKVSAYLIARKIGKEGTKGKHFLTPLDRMIEMLVKVLNVPVIKETNNAIYQYAKTLETIKVESKL